ncbi:MAG TPA: gamma-glutamyltransferase [Gemmatimonadaceae bacterium]|nr:gamma-glutamyltransferase [Gemmatimonadaceae bacterium]
MLSLAAFALLLQAASPSPASPPATAARNPAFARDGRLAASIEGDLWVRGTSGTWNRVTSGGAWDREPAWTPDGSAIVYSSDRSGTFALWKVPVGPNGAAGEPSRLTTSALPDGQPVVARDGRVVFVRGRLGAAALWVLGPDGSAARLTRDTVVEQWPAISTDGGKLAYVAGSGATRTLRVRDLSTGAESVVLSDPRIEHPAWAPAGDRLTWTATGPRGAVYVTALDGHYTNLASSHHAESAWSPDGKTLALADLPPEAIARVAYNGDPDRTGDREANLLAPAAGHLWTVDAPSAPDEALVEQAGAAIETDRAQHNANAFDQVRDRTTALYYSTPDAAQRRTQWEALAAKYRPRALAAKDDDELETVLHEMLRQHPPYRQPAVGRAAISSANPVATAAGLEMLSKGGNVVDAAVAVSFALAVVEPDASGPGGYGQMLVYRKGMDTPQLIEFMTRVPEDAGLDNTKLLQNGRLPDGGPVVANVPGTVAAMYLAWQKYGSKKLAWSDLLQPAIRAARNGFAVSDGLATTLETERDQFLKYPGSRALFFRDGHPLHAGDTLVNADLAWTLDQIAKGGADAFYKGEVAKRLVNDLHSHGNAIKLSDMERYYAAEREPVAGTYRGYTFYASAPPVSGGAELAAKFNLLEQYANPKPYSDDAGTLHAMIAAWQLVPSTRNRIADPGLWPVNTEPFTNKDTARVRWACFDPNRALDPAMLRGDTLTCATAHRTASIELARPPKCEAHGYDANQAASCRSSGTTAFMVADAAGNVVAVTQTLGTWGGNFYVTPGLGFLYNDKLTSYGTNPAMYGARLPFARHGSTIAPTIVFQGAGAARHPVMAAGAAGNAWITSAVYETLEGMIDQHLDPQAALEQPRFLISGGFFGGRGGGGGRGAAAAPAPTGATIQLEDGFSPEVMKRLEALGYHTQLVSLMGELREGYGAAVKIENGHVLAGADPRRAGAAGAIP